MTPHELKTPNNMKKHRFSWYKKEKLKNLVQFMQNYRADKIIFFLHQQLSVTSEASIFSLQLSVLSTKRTRKDRFCCSIRVILKILFSLLIYSFVLQIFHQIDILLSFLRLKFQNDSIKLQIKTQQYWRLYRK